MLAARARRSPRTLLPGSGCAMLRALALVLDRDPGDAFTFYEEWLEMSGALAFLFAAAVIPGSRSELPPTTLGRPARSRGLQVVFGICLSLATLLGVMLV